MSGLDKLMDVQKFRARLEEFDTAELLTAPYWDEEAKAGLKDYNLLDFSIRPSAGAGAGLIDDDCVQKNAIVRTSILSRLSALAGVVGSSNALCPMKRARPSVSLS